MLFTINDLGFSIAGLLLEGWLAFAARCVCALALLFIGWVVSRWMQKSLFPRLLKRSWHFAFTHPLLESFARPTARIAWYTGMYLALRSLPWAIPGLAALLLKAYRMMLVFLIGTGFYHASGIAALLLASSSEEVRTNRTLLTLLDKVYKVAVVVLCGATIAQESGLPVGSVVASAGLIGLTISLAAQDMAKNFFSGVVILLDKPFSIGDWITVGDVEGEVVDINFRSTKVRAVDNSIYILTNSTVSSATINNATLRNKRLYRFTLGVTYDTTRPQLEKLMADLDAMLKASPDTYEDTAFVRMTGFGDSSINLMVSAYLRTADLGVFLRMQNDLNLNIMDVMKADGVEFAMVRIGLRGYGSGSIMEDAFYAQNIDGAMAAGIETGVYFFAQAITVEEAIEEADFVISLLEGHEIDGPVAYDWEMHDSTYRVYGTTPEMATACAVAFCERIEEAGYDAMVYAGQYVSYIKYDQGALEPYLSWYPEYKSESSELLYPTLYYHMDYWQYSSKCSVAGIGGNVDVNLQFIRR